LNIDQEDQQFITSRRVSQSKQKHPWIKERHVGHKTLQPISIIPREVQIGET
jgi:hypothetical protein